MPGLVVCVLVFLIWKFRRRKKPPVWFAGRGWSWDQLCQGFIAFGGIGSGKSYSTRPLLEQLIAAGCPMLVTSVKPDEKYTYIKICKKLRCMHRLVLINNNRNPGGKLYSINFLDEILKTSSAADAASFIMDMGEAGGGSHGGDNAEFWRSMVHGALRYAIRLSQLAYGKATIGIVYDIIRFSPADSSYGNSARFRKNSYAGLDTKTDRFARAMARVERKNNPRHIGEFNRIQTFFRTEMCSTDKIRGSVLSSVMATLGRLVDNPWKELLSESVLTPELIQKHKLVVVIDMPVMQYHEPARLFNSLWVMMTQRYLMQRDASKFKEPFVIVRDEAGFVLSADWDSKAHNVLRQQKCCSIAIVQCLDTLKASLGGKTKSDMEAMAFASQHMHKLAFGNYSQSTNDWFSHLGGQFKGIQISGGGGPVKGDVVAEALGCQTMGYSTSYEPVVRSEAFTMLRVGWAYLFSGGRVDLVNLRRRK